MTKPSLTRQTVHQRLHETIAALISSIAGASEADLSALPITAEWSALDILRHISIWDELTARTVANWHGERNWVLRNAVLDDFNAEMVASRANSHLTEILDTILAAHKQYVTTLLNCTDAELLEQDIAPWDQELSRLELIYNILAHTLSHVREVQHARQQVQA
jgi:hypothetical protein